MADIEILRGLCILFGNTASEICKILRHRLMPTTPSAHAKPGVNTAVIVKADHRAVWNIIIDGWVVFWTSLLALGVLSYDHRLVLTLLDLLTGAVDPNYSVQSSMRVAPKGGIRAGVCLAAVPDVTVLREGVVNLDCDAMRLGHKK